MPYHPFVPPPRRWEFVHTLAEIVRGLAAERSASDVARGAYTAEPRPVTLDVPAPPPPPPRDQGGLADAPAGYRGRLTREPRLPAVFPRARRARIAWHLLTLRLPWAWYRRRFTVWASTFVARGCYPWHSHRDPIAGGWTRCSLWCSALPTPRWYRRHVPRWLAAFPPAPWWRVLWHLVTLRLVWAWMRRRVFCWFTYRQWTDMGAGNVTERVLRLRVALWKRRWRREGHRLDTQGGGPG